MEPRISNRKFAETNHVFNMACEFFKVKPTKRQASKWRNGKGRAWKGHNLNFKEGG